VFHHRAPDRVDPHWVQFNFLAALLVGIFQNRPVVPGFKFVVPGLFSSKTSLGKPSIWLRSKGRVMGKISDSLLSNGFSVFSHSVKKKRQTGRNVMFADYEKTYMRDVM
jgi:hypothetical protein